MDTKTREESVDWKCKNITVKIEIVAARTENSTANIETIATHTETRKLGFVNYDWKPYFKQFYTGWIHENREPRSHIHHESMKTGSHIHDESGIRENRGLNPWK